MARKKKLTEEQIIKKYGSVEKYDRHMDSVRKYQAEHYEELRQYRWNNRYKLRKRANQYRIDHPESVELVKKRHRERRENDSVFEHECRVRIHSRSLALSLGIYPPGSHIHHCWGFVEDRFVILDRDDHLFLHSKYGRDNEKVTAKEVLDNLKELKRKPIFVYDGVVKTSRQVRRIEKKW